VLLPSFRHATSCHQSLLRTAPSALPTILAERNVARYRNRLLPIACPAVCHRAQISLQYDKGFLLHLPRCSDLLSPRSSELGAREPTRLPAFDRCPFLGAISILTLTPDLRASAKPLSRRVHRPLDLPAHVR